MSRRSGIRFADEDVRQHKNLRRFPVISDHLVIRYDREAPWDVMFLVGGATFARRGNGRRTKCAKLAAGDALFPHSRRSRSNPANFALRLLTDFSTEL
jgi:hypothetical protein